MVVKGIGTVKDQVVVSLTIQGKVGLMITISSKTTG